jgi:hypothetical protein
VPEDRAESDYQYLPVDVPPGARSLTVSLAYDRTAGVLDLGCFGPADQFRGWSGGARSTFTIATYQATPGYLPGPLPAGTWRIALGLYRIPSEGLAWNLTAEATRSAPPTPLPPDPPPGLVPANPAAAAPQVRVPRRTLPASPGLTWLAGDMHTHSVHSDGTLTVSELAALAGDCGLDFLAVTDHNTVSHQSELAAAGAVSGVLLLPGQEVTTNRGHANVYGSIGWVDFRRPADEWVATAAERRGLLSINHPIRGDCAWLQPLATRPPLAEVWHFSCWDGSCGAPLSWLVAWGLDTVAVGGSDFHALDQRQRPGRPTTWIACAERSIEGVLDGLRAGRVAVSRSPIGPALLRVDGELVAIDADGALLTDFEGRHRRVHGQRATFLGRVGPHWLQDRNARPLAFCG